MATIPRDGRDQDKKEALDGDCLRALGHPHDHAIRQELLSAMEWDDSLHSAQVGLHLRNQLEQVQVGSTELLDGIPSGTGNPDAAGHSFCHGVQSLCRSLAARVQGLATSRGKRRSD